MNLLLLHPEDFIAADRVILRDRRFGHLKNIVRVQPGQTIEAGLLNDKTGQARVVSLQEDSMTLQVDLQQSPPPAVPLTLVLALPRPLMLKRILQTVTTMGIKEIHLTSTQRVEKSYWDSSDLAPGILRQQLLLGLEQARDTVMPQLHFHRRFTTFATNVLPTLLANRRALLAHPGNYPACPCNLGQPAVLAVGPEGGMLDDEVQVFIEHGFEAVQLGTRVLRVEAAVTALLGRLLAP